MRETHRLRSARGASFSRVTARCPLHPNLSIGLIPQTRRPIHSHLGPRRSHTGDVGGEEVDAVPVEVAAGPVVVLGGSRVGMAGKDLRVA